MRKNAFHFTVANIRAFLFAIFSFYSFRYIEIIIFLRTEDLVGDDWTNKSKVLYFAQCVNYASIVGSLKWIWTFELENCVNQIGYVWDGLNSVTIQTRKTFWLEEKNGSWKHKNYQFKM